MEEEKRQLEIKLKMLQEQLENERNRRVAVNRRLEEVNNDFDKQRGRIRELEKQIEELHDKIATLTTEKTQIATAANVHQVTQPIIQQPQKVLETRSVSVETDPIEQQEMTPLKEKRRREESTGSGDNFNFALDFDDSTVQGFDYTNQEPNKKKAKKNGSDIICLGVTKNSQKTIDFEKFNDDIMFKILAKLSHRDHVRSEVWSRRFHDLGRGNPEDGATSWDGVRSLSFDSDTQLEHFGGNLEVMQLAVVPIVKRCRNLRELCLDAKFPNVSDIATHFPPQLAHLSISSSVTDSNSDYNHVADNIEEKLKHLHSLDLCIPLDQVANGEAKLWQIIHENAKTLQILKVFSLEQPLPENLPQRMRYIGVAGRHFAVSTRHPQRGGEEAADLDEFVEMNEEQRKNIRALSISTIRRPTLAFLSIGFHNIVYLEVSFDEDRPVCYQQFANALKGGQLPRMEALYLYGARIDTSLIRTISYNCNELKHLALKCTRPKSGKPPEISAGLYTLRGLHSFCLERYQPPQSKSAKSLSAQKNTPFAPVMKMATNWTQKNVQLQSQKGGGEGNPKAAAEAKKSQQLRESENREEDEDGDEFDEEDLVEIGNDNQGERRKGGNSRNNDNNNGLGEEEEEAMEFEGIQGNDGGAGSRSSARLKRRSEERGGPNFADMVNGPGRRVACGTGRRGGGTTSQRAQQNRQQKTLVPIVLPTSGAQQKEGGFVCRSGVYPNPSKEKATSGATRQQCRKTVGCRLWINKPTDPSNSTAAKIPEPKTPTPTVQTLQQQQEPTTSSSIQAQPQLAPPLTQPQLDQQQQQQTPAKGQEIIDFRRIVSANHRTLEGLYIHMGEQKFDFDFVKYTVEKCDNIRDIRLHLSTVNLSSLVRDFHTLCRQLENKRGQIGRRWVPPQKVLHLATDIHVLSAPEQRAATELRFLRHSIIYNTEYHLEQFRRRFHWPVIQRTLHRAPSDPSHFLF